MARTVLLSAVLALALAAPASADSILYRCLPNLCRVGPDGSGQRQITRDGAEPGPVYAWLSATRDGSRLGVSFGNRAYVLDTTGSHVAGPLPNGGGPILVTQISPDGGQIATIETLVETTLPYPGGPPTPHQVPYLFVARADGSGREVAARSTVTTNWLSGRLLRDDAADDDPFEQQICVLVTNTDFPCERLVASERGHELWDPAVSPDGSLVAVTRAPVDGFSGDIAIYSAATAQLVRVVSSGPSDNAPTWSPDGRSIAFARGGGGLWVASATGAPGAERRILASGIQPVWVTGGGAATPRLSGPKRARAGQRVRIRVAGAPRGARVRLQRSTGRRWRTLATRSAGASATTFRLRLRRGRAVLRAQVRPPGGATSVSKTLRVRVR